MNKSTAIDITPQLLVDADKLADEVVIEAFHTGAVRFAEHCMDFIPTHVLEEELSRRGKTVLNPTNRIDIRKYITTSAGVPTGTVVLVSPTTGKEVGRIVNIGLGAEPEVEGANT